MSVRPKFCGLTSPVSVRTFMRASQGLNYTERRECEGEWRLYSPKTVPSFLGGSKFQKSKTRRLVEFGRHCDCRRPTTILRRSVACTLDPINIGAAHRGRM